MPRSKTLLVGFPLVALALTPTGDAAACGGCFHGIQQTESTQVTGHRMILSISKTESTLWDQISYDGDPKSFAWVLPIKGEVEVGVSSEALFVALEGNTQVRIASPTIGCPSAPFCGDNFTNVGAIAVGTGGLAGPPVTVIAQEVVGPYETVQLSASEPKALQSWLDMHGYAIPADVSPIIDTYVAEGFGFLALKLVPGQGIHAMKPVRVTTPGASTVLPLRMVAAGTGATVPITLWVLGEGLYEPTNFPSFTIPADKLVWDWDKQKSNYTALVQAGFEAAGKGWLREAGEPINLSQLFGPLLQRAQYDPVGSGYADEKGSNALVACSADLGALAGSIDEAALTVTRLHAELPRAALATDLILGASLNQEPVQRNFEITATMGKPPTCPSYPPCSDTGSGGADGMNAGCACTTGSEADASAMLGGALFSFGWILARRRRNQGRASRR